MKGPEVSEAELELLTQKLTKLTEVHIRNMNPTEIASISCEVPPLKTMLDYRTQRDDFLLQFNDARPPPHPKTYSEELLNQSVRDPDLSKKNQESMRTFFQNDIYRAETIRETLQKRFDSASYVAESCQELVQIMKSLTDYIYQCKSGLERLETTMVSSFSLSDIILQVSVDCAKSLRSSFLNAMKDRVRNFTLSERAPIIGNVLKYVSDVVTSDSKKSYVYFLPKEESEVDLHLHRLAKRFNITTNIEEDDGQKFLYYADKVYGDMWNLVDTAIPEKDIPLPQTNPAFPLEYSIQDKLIDDVTPDVKLSVMLNIILTSSHEDTRATIKEFVRFYKTTIPDNKFLAFFQLRTIHIRFLAKAILSIINYFALIKSGKDYKVRGNKKFPSIIDVLDEKGKPFVFKEAKMKFEETKMFILRVCTYFIQKHEQMSVEADITIDKEGMLESLFNHMFDYMNSVRSVIEPLLEAYEHSGNKKLFEEAITIMELRPKLVVQLYKSFDTPFALAVELMKKKGRTLRFLVNSQVLHERQTCSQFDEITPIFDRPSTLIAKDCPMFKAFPESIPVARFEVYQSLAEIYDFMDIVYGVSKEFTESLSIKGIKFIDYVELAVWKQFEEMLKEDQEVIPFDKCTTKFNFLLSDSVNSLFNSPYVNRISEFRKVTENMNEGRKLRFYLALKRFINLTSQLEDEIIRTNMLQTAYFESCDWLNISDRSVLLSPFNVNAKQGMMEINQSSSSEKVIDFAYNEFTPVNINFCSTSDVKDFLLSCNFSLLICLVQFQRLQNTILETAVRYNNTLIDSDRIVQYFEFDEKSADVFLTAADSPRKNNEDDKFLKQFIAPVLLYNSTTIYRDNQLATQDKLSFMICISHLKTRTRTILSAQTRQKEYNTDELFNLYRTEMLDAFSSYAYRYEISRITNLERQLLLDNSFITTFVLGPKPNVVLINEAGRFESHFYIPTWVECFQMMQTAPSSRQSHVLKYVLDFVLWRYMLLNIVRFDCAIDVDELTNYRQLFNSQFVMETPYFQKFDTEITKLPNSRDVDIAAQYIVDKYTNYFYRLEYTVLATIDDFFKIMKLHTTSSDELDKDELEDDDSDGRFGEILKRLWSNFYKDIKSDQRLLSKDRYIPSWMERFLEDAKDRNRLELRNLIEETDTSIEDSINGIKGTSVMESFQILPAATNILKEGIAQFHHKFAFYLLLSQHPETEITFESSIQMIDYPCVVNGLKEWNDVIMKEAYKSLVNLDEPLSVKKIVPQSKQAQAIFDALRNQIDLIILGNQIKQVQGEIDKVNAGLAKTTVKNVLSLKPDMSAQSFSKSGENLNAVTPHQAETQFNEELKYSIARLTNFVFTALDETTLERNSHDGTFSTIYDADVFEATAEKLSFALSIFGSGSVENMSSTWNDYLNTLVSEVRNNNEEIELLKIFENMVKSRLDLYVDTRSAYLHRNDFHKINKLRKKLAIASEGQNKRELAMKKVLQVDYDNLVGDMKTEINNRKNQFGGIKKNVLGQMAKKITDARSVQLQVDPDFRRDQSFSRKQVKGIDEENEELKKRIKILRVIRCIGNIATKRIFTKRIQTSENDRKQANSILWSNKLLYEETGEMLEKQLRKAHRKLAYLEIDIEKLKQQLDNEKMSNIQLVHWKAKNEHRADDLKKELAALETDEEVNIDELLENIAAKQKELDSLREDNRKFDEEVENLVRTPIREVDQMRDTIKRVSASRNEMFLRSLSSLQSTISSVDNQKRDAAAQILSDENIKLKHENELLRNKIQELKADKKTRGLSELKLMESTIKPKSQLARATSKLSTIKKPIVIPNRSISRI